MASASENQDRSQEKKARNVYIVVQDGENITSQRTPGEQTIENSKSPLDEMDYMITTARHSNPGLEQTLRDLKTLQSNDSKEHLMSPHIVGIRELDPKDLAVNGNEIVPVQAMTQVAEPSLSKHNSKTTKTVRLNNMDIEHLQAHSKNNSSFQMKELSNQWQAVYSVEQLQSGSPQRMMEKGGNAAMRTPQAHTGVNSTTKEDMQQGIQRQQQVLLKVASVQNTNVIDLDRLSNHHEGAHWRKEASDARIFALPLAANELTDDLIETPFHQPGNHKSTLFDIRHQIIYKPHQLNMHSLNQSSQKSQMATQGSVKFSKTSLTTPTGSMFIQDDLHKKISLIANYKYHINKKAALEQLENFQVLLQGAGIRGAVGLTPFFKVKHPASLSPTSDKHVKFEDKSAIYSHLEFCKNKLNQKRLGQSLRKDVIISQAPLHEKPSNARSPRAGRPDKRDRDKDRADRPEGVKVAAYKLDPTSPDEDKSSERPGAKSPVRKVFQTFGQKKFSHQANVQSLVTDAKLRPKAKAPFMPINLNTGTRNQSLALSNSGSGSGAGTGNASYQLMDSTLYGQLDQLGMQSLSQLIPSPLSPQSQTSLNPLGFLATLGKSIPQNANLPVNAGNFRMGARSSQTLSTKKKIGGAKKNAQSPPAPPSHVTDTDPLSNAVNDYGGSRSPEPPRKGSTHKLHKGSPRKQPTKKRASNTQLENWGRDINSQSRSSFNKAPSQQAKSPGNHSVEYSRQPSILPTQLQSRSQNLRGTENSSDVEKNADSDNNADEEKEDDIEIKDRSVGAGEAAQQVPTDYRGHESPSILSVKTNLQNIIFENQQQQMIDARQSPQPAQSGLTTTRAYMKNTQQLQIQLDASVQQIQDGSPRTRSKNTQNLLIIDAHFGTHGALSSIKNLNHYSKKTLRSGQKHDSGQNSPKVLLRDSPSGGGYHGSRFGERHFDNRQPLKTQTVTFTDMHDYDLSNYRKLKKAAYAQKAKKQNGEVTKVINHDLGNVPMALTGQFHKQSFKLRRGRQSRERIAESSNHTENEHDLMETLTPKLGLNQTQYDSKFELSKTNLIFSGDNQAPNNDSSLQLIKYNDQKSFAPNQINKLQVTTTPQFFLGGSPKNLNPNRTQNMHVQSRSSLAGSKSSKSDFDKNQSKGVVIDESSEQKGSGSPQLQRPHQDHQAWNKYTKSPKSKRPSPTSSSYGKFQKTTSKFPRIKNPQTQSAKEDIEKIHGRPEQGSSLEKTTKHQRNALSVLSNPTQPAGATAPSLILQIEQLKLKQEQEKLDLHRKLQILQSSPGLKKVNSGISSYAKSGSEQSEQRHKVKMFAAQKNLRVKVQPEAAAGTQKYNQSGKKMPILKTPSGGPKGRGEDGHEAEHEDPESMPRQLEPIEGHREGNVKIAQIIPEDDGTPLKTTSNQPTAYQHTFDDVDYDPDRSQAESALKDGAEEAPAPLDEPMGPESMLSSIHIDAKDQSGKKTKVLGPARTKPTRPQQMQDGSCQIRKQSQAKFYNTLQDQSATPASPKEDLTLPKNLDKVALKYQFSSSNRTNYLENFNTSKLHQTFKVPNRRQSLQAELPDPAFGYTTEQLTELLHAVKRNKLLPYAVQKQNKDYRSRSTMVMQKQRRLQQAKQQEAERTRRSRDRDVSLDDMEENEPGVSQMSIFGKGGMPWAPQLAASSTPLGTVGMKQQIGQRGGLDAMNEGDQMCKIANQTQADYKLPDINKKTVQYGRIEHFEDSQQHMRTTMNVSKNETMANESTQEIITPVLQASTPVNVGGYIHGYYVMHGPNLVYSPISPVPSNNVIQSATPDEYTERWEQYRKDSMGHHYPELQKQIRIVVPEPSGPSESHQLSQTEPTRIISKPGLRQNETLKTIELVGMDKSESLRDHGRGDPNAKRSGQTIQGTDSQFSFQQNLNMLWHQTNLYNQRHHRSHSKNQVYGRGRRETLGLGELNDDSSKRLIPFEALTVDIHQILNNKATQQSRLSGAAASSGFDYHQAPAYQQAHCTPFDLSQAQMSAYRDYEHALKPRNLMQSTLLTDAQIARKDISQMKTNRLLY